MAVLSTERAAFPLDAETILTRYQDALLRVVPPVPEVFVVSVEQAGIADLLETHRVYREGPLVRDETISVDGRRLSVPLVRVASVADRYALPALAPTPSHYRFIYLSPVREGSVSVYLFGTIPLAAASFAVDEVAIDAKTFLPRTIRFHARTGSGTLTFAPMGSHWVIQSATARAPTARGETRESLVWSDYQFPRSLPAATFGRSEAMRLRDGASGP